MLAEVRQSLRHTTTAYDLTLVGYIKAAALDLTVCGVPVEGISFSISGTTVTDNCTLTDALLIDAIMAYVGYRFRTDEKEKADYKRTYDELKGQLQHTSGYGLPEDDDE